MNEGWQIDPVYMARLRAAVFGIYQVAQWWGLESRYHFGVRAREIGRDQ